jgi:hypothetical protein
VRILAIALLLVLYANLAHAACDVVGRREENLKLDSNLALVRPTCIYAKRLTIADKVTILTNGTHFALMQ